jgi:leucyl/phenylalanyl-tRNA--protein transferase
MNSPDLQIAQTLHRYRQGDFPMAQGRNKPGYDWYNPAVRGILPLDRLQIAPALEQAVRDRVYDIRVNCDFAGMIHHCAIRTGAQEESWINQEIEALFTALHRAGHAHSIECWRGDVFAGGLYGLHPGGAVFCGESMVSLKPRASAVALVHLAARLWAGGFSLLDCQMVTPHTARFGAVDIPQTVYLAQLRVALNRTARFDPGPVDWTMIDDYLALCKRRD